MILSNILLTLLFWYSLITFISLMFTKPKYNTFNCGLFGYIGPKADVMALKILGLYNNDRGGDSCGFALKTDNLDDFIIDKGFDSKKDWGDFIVSSELCNYEDETVKVFLGHTRKASKFYSKEKETHPFLIQNQDTNIDIIGAHNGTIHNMTDLLTKYDMSDVKDIMDLDSYQLFSILNTKNYSVLKNYEGTATLTWTFPKENDSLYIYKGACLVEQWNNTTKKHEEVLVEERPLYYVRINDGYYYSSLYMSLKACFPNNKVECFPTNKVIKLYLNKDNKVIVSYPKTSDVDRSDNKQNANTGRKRVVITNVNNNINTYSSAAKQTALPWEKETEKTESSKKTKMIQDFSSLKNIFGTGISILSEPKLDVLDTTIHLDRVVYWRGRYYKNGHLCHGTFTLDKFGYKKDSPLFSQYQGPRIYYFILGMLVTESDFGKLYNVNTDSAIKNKVFVTDSCYIDVAFMKDCLVSGHYYSDTTYDFIETHSNYGYELFSSDGFNEKEIEYKPLFSNRVYKISSDDKVLGLMEDMFDSYIVVKKDSSPGWLKKTVQYSVSSASTEFIYLNGSKNQNMIITNDDNDNTKSNSNSDFNPTELTEDVKDVEDAPFDKDMEMIYDDKNYMEGIALELKREICDKYISFVETEIDNFIKEIEEANEEIVYATVNKDEDLEQVDSTLNRFIKDLKQAKLYLKERMNSAMKNSEFIDLNIEDKNSKQEILIND